MPTQYSTSPLRVSNASELTAALAAAQGSDTILLDDRDYGKITLLQNFDTAVSITVEDGGKLIGVKYRFSVSISNDGELRLFTPDGEFVTSGAQVMGQMEIDSPHVVRKEPEFWHSVSFSAEISDARVVMAALSYEGKQAGFARVRSVTDQGFEFQIYEWGYRDGRHVPETIGWIAASAGSHTLESIQTLAVERIPVVNGFTTPAALDVFDLQLQTQEPPPGELVSESVDLIALEAADQFVFGVRLATQADENWQYLGWSGISDALPSAVQTEMDRDPSVLRYDLDGSDTFRLRLLEDLSADAKTAHFPEDVHFFIAQTVL